MLGLECQEDIRYALWLVYGEKRLYLSSWPFLADTIVDFRNSVKRNDEVDCFISVG